jgi:hypothetical protein
MEQIDENKKLKIFLPLKYAAGAALAITANNPFSVLRFRLQTMPELLRQG